MLSDFTFSRPRLRTVAVFAVFCGLLASGLGGTYFNWSVAAADPRPAVMAGLPANPLIDPLTGIAQVFASGSSGFALRPDGTAVGWSRYPSLGNGDIAGSLTPVAVAAVNIQAISGAKVSGQTTLLLKRNGDVWGWGDNNNYQLGDGTINPRYLPARILGLTRIIGVSAGSGSGLALRQDGTVWTWGDNYGGQIGDGTTVKRQRPALVTGLSDVVGISAGSSHCLAVKADGTVWAWGSNSLGQVGDGTVTDRLQPLKVQGLSGVIAVSAGAFYSLALKADGTVWGWGENGSGQLGVGESFEHRRPVQTLVITNAVALSAGGGHSLVLLADGTLWAWGNNRSGELGAGRTEPVLSTPVPVIGLTNVRSFAAGNGFSYAVAADGTAKSWGAGSLLGNGADAPSRNSPGDITDALPPLPPVGQVAEPLFMPDGGTFSTRPTVTMRSITGEATISLLAAGSAFVVARLTDGAYYGWGDNQAGQLGYVSASSFVPAPQLLNGLPPDGIALAAGAQHTLLLRADGTVWAWGGNANGQLGRGTTNTTNNAPAPVNGLTNIIAVSAQKNRSMALRGDGTVWVWGAGRVNSTTAPPERTEPVQVTGLSNITKIVAGGTFNLALQSDGMVWAWGDNSKGQLGNNSTQDRVTPARVFAFNNAMSITAGEEHAAALKQDGSVWTWGDNSNGQLGTFSLSPTFSSVPVAAFTFGNNFVTVTARGYFSAGLRSNGFMDTWGANGEGQLGNGSCCTAIAGMGRVSGLSAVQEIYTGENFAMAVLSDRTLWTWGGSMLGQLGNGFTTRNTTARRNELLSNGTMLRYTIDGSEPDEDSSGLLPGSGLRLERTVTLKAKAFRAGWTPSLTHTATFNITLPNNSVDDSQFFVRQHYRDFLSREPDAAGLQYWTEQLTSCGIDADCFHRRRIDVSAAFFIELEFQDTGYFVYRLYRASFNRRPNFAEFVADRAQVIGGTDLEQLKAQFANNWVNRTDFLAEYPVTWSNAQYINHLFDQAGLIPFTAERQAAIEAMNAGRTRAQSLRNVTDMFSFQQREYNPAFVLMQYFGYLRRDADQAGYDFWLNVLNNQQPNNFRGMVCAFLTSAEYQLRFGSGVTRSNQDCGP